MSHDKSGPSRRALLRRSVIFLQGFFASTFFLPVRLLAQPLKQNIDAFRELISGGEIAKTNPNYEITRLSSVWQQINPKKASPLHSDEIC